MRTRKEIMDDLPEGESGNPSKSASLYTANFQILEVLLDIRDLLIKKDEGLTK